MIRQSDTPPDGDFAAYIERLAARNAVAGKHECKGALEPLHADRSAPSSLPAAAPVLRPIGTPAVAAASQLIAGVPWLTHLKRLVVAWVATQLLAMVVPWAGFLFVPVFLAYAGWLIFNLDRESSGAMINRVRALLAHASDEAGKAQVSHQKHKK